MKGRITPGEWVVSAAGVLLAVASLLPWYRLPTVVVLDDGVSRSFTAWSPGFAPTTLLPLVFGMAVAVPTVLARLADLQLPDRILGFGRTQLRVVLAAGAMLLVVTEVATRRLYGPVSLGRGPGLWLTLLGSCALLVGVALERRSATRAPTPRPHRP